MLTAAILADRPEILHGFSLSLDRQALPWDLCALDVGLPGAPIARARQVHGRSVLRVSSGGDAGEADALISETPGLLIGVVTADCVPVLVAGDGIVAAIHAGWRGIAGGVIEAAFEALGPRGPFVAAIGPCISPQAYEVGEEVIEGITQAGVPEHVVAREHPGRPRRHADLRAAARFQLQRCGCARVEVIPHCTFEDSRFSSFRRQGAGSGRQLSLVGIRPR